MTPHPPTRLRLAYLFTTFPEASETFLQREVRAMRGLPVDFELHSLWGGAAEWEGGPVARFPLGRLASLVWWLPYWAWRRPRAVFEVCQTLARQAPPSRLNALENLLGLGFALVEAHRFAQRERRPHLCHGVWATAPAAAAWLLERLLGIPYTMGAHAYDVFQNGGDWLLGEKLRRARLIHTTTAATRARLLERGAEARRIALVRRGLDEIPPLQPRRTPGKTLRLLAVGRLVPKKGFEQMLRILEQLRVRGMDFECKIVGDGPLAEELRAQVRERALAECVELSGCLDHREVVRLQREWADCFLFTGIVAPDGDRDGLPNVIPEAMAAGLPVVTSPVAGTTEAISDGVTGFVVPLGDWDGWREAILRATAAPAEAVRRRAHAWVAENFDARRNAAQLAEAVRHAVMGHRSDAA
ncbi:MAG: glycosyltransferase [Opitutales bacterium]|jgi:glycosyltransferase involved in cell wall biosynthesis